MSGKIPDLTESRFRDWLSLHRKNQTVGLLWSVSRDPVANFLKSLGYTDVEARWDRIIADGKEYELPVEIHRLMDRYSRLKDKSPVRAGDLIQYLWGGDDDA